MKGHLLVAHLSGRHVGCNEIATLGLAALGCIGCQWVIVQYERLRGERA